MFGCLTQTEQFAKFKKRLNKTIKGENTMNNYFRITAYNPEHNIGFIADSYGKFEKLWQFSSYLIQHGCKIIEVNNSDYFLDYKNLPLLAEPSDKIIIRAIEEGRTNCVPHVLNGNNCKIVVMGNKQYIPDVAVQQ